MQILYACFYRAEHFDMRHYWKQKFKEFLKHTVHPWFTYIAAALVALDIFVGFIPSDVLLVSAVLARPRKWFSIACWITLGSCLGALLLAFLVRSHMDWLMALMPGVFASSGWETVRGFIAQYGGITIWIGVLGLMPLLPFIIVPILAGYSLPNLMLFYFLGRFVKMCALAWCASHAPRLLKKFFGMKTDDAVWDEAGKNLVWTKPWQTLKNTSFAPPVKISWFEGGELNACFNCVDRHAQAHPDRLALLWEPDDPASANKKFTYAELLNEVSVFANLLIKHGVKRGDVVTLYLPLIPEAIISMLACARIGAVHSVVFGGFSAEALANRIIDAESKVVITASHSQRGGKRVEILQTVREALEGSEGKTSVEKIIVFDREELSEKKSNEVLYSQEKSSVSNVCPYESIHAESPLFMLYTSGSTGKPKGLVHSTGGYLAYAAHTFRLVFNYQPGEIFWCTADVGWITGHSYVVYGPLANGATVLLHEGVPTFPSFARCWEIVDKYQVNIFYTAPTAIRALMREGNEFLQSTSRKSLKVLGSVGEPLNPEAWRWYREQVGGDRCAVVDTWWQTETGGILLSPLAKNDFKIPGSVARPLPGIHARLLDETQQEISGAGSGYLCLKDSWPGQAQTIFKDHARFETTYFERFPGYYFSGDGASRDEHGNYFISGRVDDVLNVSGHRIGTAEVESALVGYELVCEVAVVGIPDAIKGEGIFAFVTLKDGSSGADHELLMNLNAQLRKVIGPIAKIERLQLTRELPKTRSGKIMRRLLKKIANGETSSLGDISTLANPEIVEELLRKVQANE